MNDRLTNVLADVDKDPKDRMPLTHAASASDGEEEIDLSAGVENLKVGLKPAAADPFATGADLLDPTPAEDDPFSILDGDESKPTAGLGAAAKTEEDEDFDAFFKDRTTASGSKED